MKILLTILTWVGVLAGCAAVNLLGQGCRLSGTDQCGNNAVCTAVPRCSSQTGFGVCWCQSDQFVQPRSLLGYKQDLLYRRMNETFWSDCVPILQIGQRCVVSDPSQEFVSNAVCSNGIVQCQFGFRFYNGRCSPEDSEDRSLGEDCGRDRECDDRKNLKCMPTANIKPLQCQCVSGLWRNEKCVQGTVEAFV